MYLITSDHVHFIRLNDENLAKRLADNIAGVVYTSKDSQMELHYDPKEA